MNCEFSLDTWGHPSLEMSWCRSDLPTSLPSGSCAHVHRLCSVRLTAPHCTPPPSTCKPSWCPNCRQRGVMWAWRATSRACGTAEEGVSGAKSTSLTAGAETSGATTSGSWGWLGDGGSWGMVACGGLGWDRGHGGMRHGSPQETT